LKILVFAGTSEGRKICRYLAYRGVFVTACVATTYGSQILPNLPSLKIMAGRLSEAEIEDLICAYDYVIDATHPYAQVISACIRKATNSRRKNLIRIIRPAAEDKEVIKCASI